MSLDHLEPVGAGSTRIYLCRHGETDYNVQLRFQGRGVDSELNKHGELQAKKLGLAFRNIPLQALYCSFLTRAKATAEAIAKHHDVLAPVVVDGLEEMYFGTCEGIVLQDLYDLWASTIQAWLAGDLHTAWPEGESPLDVEKRGLHALHSVLSPNVQHVALVCHGRFNKLLLASILYNDMTKVETLTQDNTCINVLDFDHATKTFTPRCLNYTGHWNLAVED